MTETTPLVPIKMAGSRLDRATHGLVLVHGRGASGADILGLGQALDLPNLALAAPEAPGGTWWPTSFLAPSAQIEPWVQSGLAAIDAAIAALIAGGLARTQISVAGFSQGACLALEYAARRGDLHSAFGLSGGLLGTSDAAGPPDPALYGYRPKRFEGYTNLQGMPVLISVHQQDPHIPLKRAEDSREVFGELGAIVETQTYPGAGHGVLSDGVASIRRVLNSAD
jgi:phospholipase/carboxylesterase